MLEFEMSQIKQSLLNRTVNIYRNISTKSPSGDKQKNEVINIVNLKVRIDTNTIDSKTYNDKFGQEVIVSSHIMFCNSDLDIIDDDIVKEGTDKYIVVFVNKNPGGVIGHHMEVFINYSNLLK